MMDNENQTKVSIEVNEVGSERMDQPDVKEFTDSVKNLLHQCNEKNIPIICLTNDPESSVAVLGIQGSPTDFIILLSEAMKRIPRFDKVVKKALDIALLSRMANESVESLLKEVFRKSN